MSWIFSAALVNHCENLRFSLGAVEESLAVTCSDGKQSAQSKSENGQLLYLPKDRMTEFSRLSRYGMTFAHLTGRHGRELLTLFQADFHARTYQWQEKAKELLVNDLDYGKKCGGSFARWDHNLSTWRTAQRSLVEDSELSLGTWPESGIAVDGACYPLAMLAPGTSEKESGFLPTLTVCGNYNKKGASATSGDGLATVVKKMATLCARDYRGSGRSRLERTGSKAGDCLPQQIGGPLNADWCEWYMGFPVGWTELKPLEMHRFLAWQQAHSSF